MYNWVNRRQRKELGSTSFPSLCRFPFLFPPPSILSHIQTVGEVCNCYWADGVKERGQGWTLFPSVLYFPFNTQPVMPADPFPPYRSDNKKKVHNNSITANNKNINRKADQQTTALRVLCRLGWMFRRVCATTMTMGSGYFYQHYRQP